MLAKRGRGGKGRKVVYTLQREASLGELVGMSVSHPCALPLANPPSTEFLMSADPWKPFKFYTPIV